MNSPDNPIPPDYIAARHGVIYYPLTQPGLLRIAGLDRIAFLQRQTTNNLEQIIPGMCQVSVLINPSARILDVFQIFSENETLKVITLPGFATGTTHFLQSRIFFMDKVTVENISQEYIQLDLDGPNAPYVLLKLGWSQAPQINEVIAAMDRNFPVIAIGQKGFNERGFRLLIPEGEAEKLFMLMNDLGAIQLSPEVYDILCIETGTPVAGRELNHNYTPLEVGLGWAVSADKGCYTGQEVIARQITYDKINQSLVGLRLSAPVQPGTQLWAGEKPVGNVTSYVTSPVYRHIALGIVKRPFNNPGTTLLAISKVEEAPVPVEVTKLPFEVEN